MIRAIDDGLSALSLRAPSTSRLHPTTPRGTRHRHDHGAYRRRRDHARPASRRRILVLIPHFLRGTQATQPEIQMVRASKITIEAIEGVLPAQTDGEIISTEGKRLDIELIPRGLEVITAQAGSTG